MPYMKLVSRMVDKPLVFRLPPVITGLWNAHKKLIAHYAETGLKFTLDGKLVGDLGEAIALEYFDLETCPRTPGVDALVRGSGDSVQVKATGRNAGPAFSWGEGVAKFLLFMKIDFEAGTASVLYNGPEAPVRATLPKEWSGTTVVKLSDVRALQAQVPRNQRLRLKLRARVLD